jgi:tetratricopeptide (TPR) repeat protein
VIAMPAAWAVVYEYGPGHQLAVGLANKADEELGKGNIENARRDVDEALRIDPAFFPARYIRASIFLRQRKWELAIQDCEVGLKQQPTFVDLAVMRAIANRALGKYAASLAELDHVIRLRPERVSVYSWAFDQRAWLRATCPDASFRNGRQAISDAKQACNLTRWKDANIIDTLAAAYAEAGDFNSAVRYEEQAMSARDSSDISSLLQEHLTLFKQHRPVREVSK